MNPHDFQAIAEGHKQVLSAALEVATADSALSSYRIQAGTIEVDPDTNKELTAEEQEMVEAFQTDNREQVEAIVRQQPAQEGLVDMVVQMSVAQVLSEVTSTVSRVRNAVKVYANQNARLNATLKACAERLKRENPKKPLPAFFEFGAYSRFFHIGNRACDTIDQFISGIYIHRASSEWCGLHAGNAVKEVYASCEKALISLSRHTPALNAIATDGVVEAAGEIVMRNFESTVLTPAASRSFLGVPAQVPRGERSLKDIIVTAKGNMLDNNVLCLARPSKAGQRPAWGAIVLHSDEAVRTKAEGFELKNVGALLSVIEHGIEITSNNMVTLDQLKDLNDDVLKPLEDAIRSITRRLNARFNDERAILVSYASIARILCNTTTNPLLSTVWLDLRLARMISAMAELHFVPDASKRVVLKQDIAKA